MRSHASITESLLSQGLGGYNTQYGLCVRESVHVCICVCALTPVVSILLVSLLERTFFDFISAERRGLSVCIFIAGSVASSAAVPLAELSSTMQLLESKYCVSNMCSTVCSVRGTISYCCLNLCLTRLCIFLTNHDYCHNLSLQPSHLSLPPHTSMTTSFYLPARSPTSTMYLQGLK